MTKIICFNCRNTLEVERIREPLTKTGKISKKMIEKGFEQLRYANTHADCCDNPDYRGQ